MHKASLLFLAATLSLNSPIITYTPLSDITMSECYSSDFDIEYSGNNYHIDYKVCSQLGETPKKAVTSNIKNVSLDVFEFADSVNVSGAECIPNSNLEIYNVDMKLLNDKARFNNWKSKGSTKIWALYDPVIKDPKKASIMLTEHGEDWNKVLFGHELAHYWYDKFCWNKTWDKDSEQFALDFEKFYLKKRGIK